MLTSLCMKVNKFIERSKSHGTVQKKQKLSKDGLTKALEALEETDINPEDVDQLLGELLLKKQRLEDNNSHHDLVLLHSFLLRAKSEKTKMLEQLHKVISCIDSDLQYAEKKLEMKRASKPRKRTFSDVVESELDYYAESSAASSKPTAVDTQSTADCRTRVNKHFDDLQQTYLGWRLKESESHPDSTPLISFSGTLSKFSKYSRFKPLAKIQSTDRLLSNAGSIISSMDFDRDDEYFATAGVTRKIKIYDYASVTTNYTRLKKKPSFASLKEQKFVSALNLERMSHLEEYHNRLDLEDKETPPEFQNDELDDIPRFPLVEMASRSKISCLSWNWFLKSHIISADYEGVVTVWDANRAVSVHQFEEHDKRAWSVDFCRMDPTLAASGGDDTKVKIWSITQRTSVATIETRASVCSVKWNPNNSFEFVFGSADHGIHYYDIRKPTIPVHVFVGHRKAVSYVNFLSTDEIISSSTDCTLRCWNLDAFSGNGNQDTLNNASESYCSRVFSGHVNEKNFVGLSINSTGEFISCGSETNAVYAYYSKLSDPIIVDAFGKPIESIHGGEVPQADPSHFVSSVCWKRKSPDILLAANSEGRIKVMQMI
ncbi:RING finger and WD repeat domain-containing protein 2 [Phlyctochytrium planicorne]|nr:RING finger and WD repeat domain-containing protein 2 [Phlyctochytrium planicorne]